MMKLVAVAAMVIVSAAALPNPDSIVPERAMGAIGPNTFSNHHSIGAPATFLQDDGPCDGACSDNQCFDLCGATCENDPDWHEEGSACESCANTTTPSCMECYHCHLDTMHVDMDADATDAYENHTDYDMDDANATYDMDNHTHYDMDDANATGGYDNHTLVQVPEEKESIGAPATFLQDEGPCDGACSDNQCFDHCGATCEADHEWDQDGSKCHSCAAEHSCMDCYHCHLDTMHVDMDANATDAYENQDEEPYEAPIWGK